MSIHRHILHCLTLAFTAILVQALPCQGQDVADSLVVMEEEPLVMMDDSISTLDTIHFEPSLKKEKVRRDWSTWRPDPKRALWLAVVIPGAGQIYNRKFWKLPIVYGGFVGCAYAMSWNNQMYKDYSQAFLDLSDNNPATQSYNQFLHLGTKIESENDSKAERFRNLFKRRKDYYRRYRDLSFFIMVGVYALSVIDAYVDASLSDFDISKDLTLRVSPTMINNSNDRNPIRSNALGLQCSLNF